jgi:hypothetical protein
VDQILVEGQERDVDNQIHEEEICWAISKE